MRVAVRTCGVVEGARFGRLKKGRREGGLRRVREAREVRNGAGRRRRGLAVAILCGLVWTSRVWRWVRVWIVFRGSISRFAMWL